METLYDWVQSIAVYMILVSVITNLLPKNHYEKYVRLFAGMVMIVLLLRPFSSLLQISNRLDRVFTLDIWKQELSSMEADFAGVGTELEDIRMESYGEELKRQVMYLLEEDGVEVEELEYEICMEAGDERYGQLTGIKIYLESRGDVKIESPFLKEYEETKNSRIKEKICEYYQLEREQVVVYG